MTKLRAVEYTYRTNCVGFFETKSGTGWFHTWGQRGDENLTEFFAVVEIENGHCVEMDPSEIWFKKEVA